MLRSFEVNNFRCFRHLRLGPLDRINIIAGKNNTGKTALLEALLIYSYPADAQIPFAIHAQRGMQDHPTFDADLASWLFYDRDVAHGSELRDCLESGQAAFFRRRRR